MNAADGTAVHLHNRSDRPPVDQAGPAGTSNGARLLGLALAGAGVAVALGVYGRVHPPTGTAAFAFGFPSVITMKVALGTAAFVLALGQLVSALWMYGRLPLGRPPRGLAVVHRWSGTAAFLVSLPVAYHCLWSLGFQTTGARQVAHGLLGCAFYGVFTTKVLALRAEDLPRWTIPVLGSLLVALMAGLWVTSSLWFFTSRSS